MKVFDPILDISGASLILDAGGAWPNFHDSIVHSLNFWRGDIRPEENVWIGPVIDATLELAALEKPFLAILRFHDCSGVSLENFDWANDVFDLTFAFQDRGFYSDGQTPLPPHIRVKLVPCQGFSLQFDCFAVEVLERRETEPNAHSRVPTIR